MIYPLNILDHHIFQWSYTPNGAYRSKLYYTYEHLNALILNCCQKILTIIQLFLMDVFCYCWHQMCEINSESIWLVLLSLQCQLVPVWGTTKLLAPAPWTPILCMSHQISNKVFHLKSSWFKGTKYKNINEIIIAIVCALAVMTCTKYCSDNLSNFAQMPTKGHPYHHGVMIQLVPTSGPPWTLLHNLCWNLWSSTPHFLLIACTPWQPSGLYHQPTRGKKNK